MIPPGSSGSARRFRFGESSDNVAQHSELLAERRFRTQVTLNEIAENENYKFLSQRSLKAVLRTTRVAYLESLTIGNSIRDGYLSE